MSGTGGRVSSIRDVAERQLCSGCGACAYISPDEIEMIDMVEFGRRPLVADDPQDPRTGEALAVCPGAGLSHDVRAMPRGLLPELLPAWGPVLSVWEGHATHPDVRFQASSGGAATALALACIEEAGMHGVLHARARRDVPYLNETTLSHTRAELLAATGSRYAPASPCEGLERIASAPGPCVFIGKPCDVAAAERARRLRPDLDARLGLTVAMFCAGTPSTRGTLAMMERFGIEDPSAVTSVRYRGRGWPGLARVSLHRPDGSEVEHTATYAESWDLLQRYRQWRCYVCADHTGEFADVAVGDPWYREIPEDEPGRSLVLVRSERGRRAVRLAVDKGHLTLEPSTPDIVFRSQPELLRTRGAIAGRMLTTRVFGVATPRYRGLPIWRFWWSQLSLRQKLQSLFGTAKRVFRKRLRERVTIQRDAASSDGEAG
ncbi:MAG: Coenzyme F420 hydrogenase/dehydrogenase, beta subunit C-terminal domain [Myxococcota bacterium]